MKIRIATLNINNSRNVNELARIINTNEIDIFTLNECGSNLPSKLLLHLFDSFNYNYSSADYCGNVIFSRYDIINKKDIKLETKVCSVEMRSAALIIVNIPIEDTFVEIGFVGTHLSHIHESDRKDQIRSLIHQIPYPTVIMGDLNALYRLDYTQEQWDEINSIRENGGWLFAESRVMDYLFQSQHYRDTRREYLNITPPQSLNSTINLNRVEGTCRFDTRIDWILLPPVPTLRREQSPTNLIPYDTSTTTLSSPPISIEIAPNTDGYQVIDTSYYTDHNLVIVDLLISIQH